MSIEQASPLVPIKPQVALQNGAFIKNSHNRSSFCGVVPSPTNGNGTLKTFAVNRKSWSGNGTLPLQHYAEPPATTPELATFKTGTGTFPRHRERNNNAEDNEASGILTPNGNSTQTFGGNVRRSAGTGSANGRRYAEIGNWSKRSSTFLEPHLQGVGVRGAGAGGDGEGSSESDGGGAGRGAGGAGGGAADEARALLRRSPRTPRARRARRNDNSPPYRTERTDNAPGDADCPDAPPALNPREFFERLQTRARAPPAAAPPSLRDSLSQSRESLSSDGEGARGDCSSVGTSGSGSEPQVPCDIGLLERLIRTHPVWFLPGIQRAGAFHLLQGKEEGNFVVRQSSQPDTMAVSVRLPQDKGPYIEHYLIQAGGGRIGLETSQNKFDNIPELIAHYAQCCDELPVQLALPRALRDAKSRHQLSSLALLGQEFWGYPMAAPRAHAHLPPSPPLPAAAAAASEPTPMALTPSDASSLASFSAGISNGHRVLSPEAEPTLRPSPMESGSPPGAGLSTFKGRPAPSPPAHSGTFVRAPRPTPPNTLNLISTTAHITQQFPSPTQPGNPKTTPPPPPPRWAKPPFPKSALPPSPEMCFSPVSKPPMSNGNITVTTTVTFSVNNTQIHNHQINENVHNDRLQLTLASNPMHNNNMETIFNGNDLQSNGDLTQNMVNRLSPDGECISSITATLHGSFKRQFTEQHAADPCSPQDTNTDPANTYTKSTSFVPNQIVSPNGSNSVTSGIFSPTSQINSPNETVSSKSGVFSPLSQITNKSELFSPVSRSSPISGKNVFSPISNQSFQNNSVSSPLMGKERDKLVSPNTNTASSTPSGRSRKSKHSMRKESRHYQESDILESPGVYCRSSLLDKVSDYEDIWGPESPSGCTTFKPDSAGNKQGMMMSKRPDLLPDTLPKLNAAKSTNSILEKENLILMASNDSLNKKHLIDQDTIMKPNFKNSSELIATTNSRGEVVPKRPDKLNIMRSANKQLTEEVEAANKENNDLMDISKSSDDLNGTDRILGEPEKDKASSPFYADPVDAIKEAAALPLVQRRKLLRVGASLAQRYSEPPTNHPYYPLRDMHSIEELSPSSANTSSSVDNLAGLRTGRPKMKPVQPPRVAGKPPPAARNDPTWAVDSSWEFISAQEEGGSESGTFPSLAEQECRLSGADGSRLTVHQVVAQRLPELRLGGAPAVLPEERCPPRASRYDNVLDHRPVSEQASDDGTVFSEPWDCAQWDGLLPPSNNHLSFDGEEEREWESPLSGRKSLAAVARAKSFRDRLDPLLAAGRLRALRGGRGARGAGAGAALRAYALHLAQDKSTTFAQNVDNFIACTLDSKEICPQVVMRNMRQFMSGMKNYLVKHGEREFEKEVEKERMKLKSTEFLNLDAILETVMHRLVVRPLRARLYALLADWHAADVRALHAAIERAADTTPLQMGIKATTNIPSAAVLAVISRHFVKMQEADSPLDKLENLLAAISAIFNSIRGERALGADDLLPMLAWVVARCRLVCAELEAELMAGLLPPALLAGEGGYYLTALFSAVAVLKKLAPAQHEPAASWRRSSLESGGGGGGGSGQACVVRVALPDECRGSIRRVALPCRAGARARDLCRALAHQAAITNPQDYALFALHNGQETMLSENDCPQEAMSEKNGKDCILAYKRIDAKIAWPQHALLSLP